MIHIRCHECGRKYNWAGDAFCPHCGAFNQAEEYSFDRERIVVELEEPESARKSKLSPSPASGKTRRKASFAAKIIAFSITIVWVVLIAVVAVLLQIM